MRLITLESLLRGLSSNRCGWVVKTRDLLHLTDKDVKAELERTAPTTRWQVNLVGFENIYVNTSMSCDPAAAWTLLFEEWASNVRHHRPSLPPQQPVAKITITRVPDGLSCNLEFGPFPGNSAQADARLSGHGSTLIRFCVDVLTPGGRLLHGFEKMRDGTCAWRLHFTIPEDRWEELCR